MTDPRERTRFFGRRRELAALSARVASGARLVTLHGPAGVGKTRLAKRASVATTWVDVATARTAEDVAAAVAAALAIPLLAGDAASRVGDALEARDRLVLLLDGFEGAAAAASATLGAWLDAAPRVTFVVTSRTRLAVAGEEIVPVEPLAIEDAVELFVDRARAIGVEIDARERSRVEAVVDRLDRLPLAIELAAARARALPLPALLERLVEDASWLDRRSAPLDGAVSWSIRLLAAHERLALSRLASFVGSFDLDMAEDVLAPDVEALAAIERLLDHSLLRADGRGRFALFRAVREQVLRTSSQEELATSRARHARAVVRAASRVARDLVGRSERAALDALAELRNDLTAAASAEDASTAARAVLLLEPLAQHRGPIEPFLRLASGLLSRAIDPDVLRARGELRRVAGDVEGARADLREAHRLADDPHLAARIVRVLAPLEGGDVERALDEVVRVAGAVGDAKLLSETLGRLGHLRLEAGDLDGARRRHARALAVAEQAGSPSLEAIARCSLGTIATMEHRYAEARAHLERARALFAGIGNTRLEGVALEHLTALLHEAGDLDAALVASEQARALHRSTGDRLFEGPSLFAAGSLELARGRLDEGETFLRRAVDACAATDDQRFLGFSRGWLGVAALLRGDHAAARVELEAAARIADARADRHLAAHAHAFLALATDDPVTACGTLDAADRALDLPTRLVVGDLVEVVAAHLRATAPPKIRSAEARMAAKLIGARAFAARRGRWALLRSRRPPRRSGSPSEPAARARLPRRAAASRAGCVGLDRRAVRRRLAGREGSRRGRGQPRVRRHPRAAEARPRRRRAHGRRRLPDRSGGGDRDRVIASTPAAIRGARRWWPSLGRSRCTWSAARSAPSRLRGGAGAW